MHIERHEVSLAEGWQTPPRPHLGKAVAFRLNGASPTTATVWFKGDDDGEALRSRRFVIVRDGDPFDRCARYVATDTYRGVGFHLLQEGP